MEDDNELAAGEGLAAVPSSVPAVAWLGSLADADDGSVTDPGLVRHAVVLPRITAGADVVGDRAASPFLAYQHPPVSTETDAKRTGTPVEIAATSDAAGLTGAGTPLSGGSPGATSGTADKPSTVEAAPAPDTVDGQASVAAPESVYQPMDPTGWTTSGGVLGPDAPRAATPADRPTRPRRRIPWRAARPESARPALPGSVRPGAAVPGPVASATNPPPGGGPGAAPAKSRTPRFRYWRTTILGFVVLCLTVSLAYVAAGNRWQPAHANQVLDTVSGSSGVAPPRAAPMPASTSIGQTLPSASAPPPSSSARRTRSAAAGKVAISNPPSARAGSAAPTHSSSGNGPSNGAKMIVGVQSGRCIDIFNYETTSGIRAELWDCKGENNQTFTYTAGKQLTVYGNKCLDAYGQGMSNGTMVAIWDCDGLTNQQWNINSDGTISGVQSGLCMFPENQGTVNGTLINLWECNGHADQRWSLR